jgi:hypothetical protein
MQRPSRPFSRSHPPTHPPTHPPLPSPPLFLRSVQIVAGVDRYLFDHARFLWSYLVASGTFRTISTVVGEDTRVYLQVGGWCGDGEGVWGEAAARNARMQFGAASLAHRHSRGHRRLMVPRFAVWKCVELTAPSTHSCSAGPAARHHRAAAAERGAAAAPPAVRAGAALATTAARRGGGGEQRWGRRQEEASEARQEGNCVRDGAGGAGNGGGLSARRVTTRMASR